MSLVICRQNKLVRTFLLTSALIIFLLSSCSRYQYVTISGIDVKKNDDREFLIDNDSLMIKYNFNGFEAPINLTIENKLNVPVYIDWRQSALIVNDRAISYVPNTVPVSGSFDGSAITWGSGNVSTGSGNVQMTATFPDNLGFIPPQSFITKNPMGITNISFDASDSVFGRKKVTLPDGSAVVKVRHATFSEKTSPLQFRSYITVRIGEQTATPVSYEQSFYISEIYATGLGPEIFWQNNVARGNQYFVRETTGFGKGFGIVAGAAVITTITALEQGNTASSKE